MSTIDTTGSSLKADTKPAALLEAALLLDNAEKTRNGANPGVASRNNITLTIAVDEGTANISATIPATMSIGGSGSITYTPNDYLGSVYTSFTAGGDVSATNRVAAFVQIAQLLSASEKAILPVEDQPNNVQVESSSEAGTITVTAALPVSFSIDASSGAVTISAIDYL